jgi:hypothetical protein
VLRFQNKVKRRIISMGVFTAPWKNAEKVLLNSAMPWGLPAGARTFAASPSW